MDIRVEAWGEPGASAAGVALANGINANQLRRWMHDRGVEPPRAVLPAFTPGGVRSHRRFRPGAAYPERHCTHPPGTAQRRRSGHIECGNHRNYGNSRM